MKPSVVAGIGVALSLSTVSSAFAVTNEWTKTASGYWEEPYWSVGLPTVNQEAVAFRNSGWKALAIGTNTTARHPASLRVNNLIIDAPADSANQLLLNWAGLSVPLVVRSNLIIGTNGSLASHSSALQAATVDLQGFAALSDSARAALGAITLSLGGALNLNEAALTCSNLGFYGGTVTQTMGVAVISGLASVSRLYPPRINDAYVLTGGFLNSGRASIGYYGTAGSQPFAFVQSGGVHSNSSMTLWGGQRRYQLISHAGRYYLNGGLLVSTQLTVSAGTLEQNGGTNLTRELIIGYGGYYRLNGGYLVTSNVTASTVDRLHRGFFQNGGSHSVQGRLKLQKEASYSLTAGTLSVPIIEVTTTAGLGLLGGAISNRGMVLLRGGRISVEEGPWQLGKLQVLEVDEPYWPNSPSTLYLASTNAPAVLRFQDSRDVSWSGDLRIHFWSTNRAGRGPDRIFVGASAQALTPGQLSRITFVRHAGLNSDYAAALTAAGELVPGAMREYEYVVSNRTVTLTRYTGPGGNVTVPGTIDNLPVVSIGNAFHAPTVFDAAAGMTSITLPNTITNIADWAFYSCRALTNVIVPASVRAIGSLAFVQCTNLLAITVHPDNRFYSSIDGVLFNKNQTQLTRFPLGKTGAYAVPPSVTSIEDYAFSSCYQLTNVILSALTNIGDAAFQSCFRLANVTFPEGLKTIGGLAFESCGALTSINLPDSLTSIGERAFQDCDALARAEIGRGLATFGGDVFTGNDVLAGVYFRGDAPAVTSDFLYSTPTIYYLPGTIGWGPTFAGRPTAPWQPLIVNFGPSFGIRTNRFGFIISWPRNAQIIIEASRSLANPQWSAVATNTLTGGSTYFSDIQAPNSPNRFYRLRMR